MKRERRTIHGLEVRVANGGKTINGHAAVFNEEYVLWNSPTLRVVERIKPGTFTRAIQEKQDVRCLFNHTADNILGRTKADTLTMEQDDKGLKFDCSLPDTQLGRDLPISISRRDITGCSFAFIVRKEKRDEEERDGKTVIQREIQDVDLFDVGPVTYPAYEGTDVGARASELRGMFDEEDVPLSVLAVLKGKRDSEDDLAGDNDIDDQMQECACRCRACFSGDHEECSMYMETCADSANCQQMAAMRSARDDKKENKTKRVDGEDLSASAFLYVGDPAQTDTWALPWKFSSTEKTKAHLRNALARFDQTKKIPADKKAGVYKKLVAKCNEYGIHVSGESEQKSADFPLDLAQARTRTLLAEVEC